MSKPDEYYRSWLIAQDIHFEEGTHGCFRIYDQQQRLILVLWPSSNIGLLSVNGQQRVILGRKNFKNIVLTICQ